MKITEAFAKNSIFLDPGSEPMYGSDQAYDSCPVRFPTVGFGLVATNGLTGLADRIRVERGFRPMYPMDGYADEACDSDGWYDFYIGINGYTASGLDNAVEFVVVNSDSPDNGESYAIELDADEQACLFARLDGQCRAHLGKSCAELLKEAEREMEEDGA